MNKILISVTAGALMLLGIITPAKAETNLNLSNLTVEQLTALVEKLTAQIKALSNQVNSQNELIAKLRLNSQHMKGERGSEIVLLQQILATDPALYPEALTTGFFGDLTARAIGRLQARFGLVVTGTLNPETRELINKILDSEKADRVIPPGLLRAPGLEGRVIVKVENNGGNIVYKIEIKDEDSDDVDENEDEDENESDDNDEEDDNDNDDEDLEIDVEISDDDARVVVQQNSVETIFTLDETDEDEIIAKLVRRLGLTEDEIEDAIDFENEDDEEDDD